MKKIIFVFVIEFLIRFWILRFMADKAGTYWYHSHLGTQRSMGIAGPLIVLPKSREDELLRRVRKGPFFALPMSTWKICFKKQMDKLVFIPNKCNLRDRFSTETIHTNINCCFIMLITPRDGYFFSNENKVKSSAIYYWIFWNKLGIQCLICII